LEQRHQHQKREVHVSGYKKIYLTVALEYYEYMKIPLALFPRWIVEQYDLSKDQLDGWVHLEMRRAVWGLPQAGILANKKLKQKLAPFEYRECIDTPGLWKHESRPLTFTLVVDDFGVKYEKKEDAEHLIASIKATYKLTKDWTGNLYCGITLDWDYANRTVDISMPGYIRKKLHEYNHVFPGRLQACPYTPAPKKFGAQAQTPLEVDSSPQLDAKGIERVQQIVGSILYYARAVDMTVLMALSAIAVEQTKATTRTLGKCMQLFDYLASNSEAKVRVYASNMIMNLHSDASYLSETGARSRACGHFFMGWMPKKLRTHKNQWCILCERNHHEIRGGVSGRGRAGSPLPQLSRWNNIPENTGGHGASATKNTGALR
jgi:hypothetical protein